jgi:hypothetical protein
MPTSSIDAIERMSRELSIPRIKMLVSAAIDDEVTILDQETFLTL